MNTELKAVERGVEADPTIVVSADDVPIAPRQAMFFIPGQDGQPGKPVNIKGYLMRRLIGSGAMGVVFEAEHQTTHRIVALKVLRGGEAMPDRLKRFVLEAQVLNQMHHPGIAKLYETGMFAADDGQQPYFAMEMIHGRSLNKHVTENGLNLGQRVGLLIQICNAMQYAHLRGVVHRDLKPGNILVNDAGQPKILDFGLARVTNSDIQAVTMHTAAGQILGSLNYMSPEQASGMPDQIDFRADIYALGVIGFSMFSGRLPLNLRNKPLYLAIKDIQETQPPLLGTILPELRGDLESIIAKALQKKKERRYQNASDLAEDLERFLRGEEPVL